MVVHVRDAVLDQAVDSLSAPAGRGPEGVPACGPTRQSETPGSARMRLKRVNYDRAILSPINPGEVVAKKTGISDRDSFS
jgi:hypothetical protein